MKSCQMKHTETGEINLIKKRVAYRPNWNGAMIDTTSVVFGSGLPNCSVNEEMLTVHDILNCLTFSDRNDKNVTMTFTKDFLRKILKSHVHNLNENKII